MVSSLTTPPRFTFSHLLISLVLAIVALGLFSLLATEVMEGTTLQFDNFTRQALHGLATPALTRDMRLLTLLGSIAFLGPAVLLTAGALWMTGRHRRAVLLVVTMLGGLLLVGVLKLTFHRQRPEAYFGTRLPASYSFPSGHSLLSACFYGVLAAFATVHEKRLARRWLIWVAAGLLVLGIGTSRVYLGVHYTSDVLAGYLAALIWTMGVTTAYLRMYHLAGQPIRERQFET